MRGGSVFGARGRARAALALALACGLLLGPGCGTRKTPDAGRGHPTLWRAEREGAGPVFLLGSVHLGTPGALALGETFEKAWQRSEELVLEVDLSRYDEAEGERLMDRYGRIPEPASLEDRVSPETWELFVAYLDQRGMTAASMEHYQPWLAATMIAVFEFHDLGLDPEHGVDRALLQRALDAGMPVVGVETLESQFAKLAGLPDAVQELMLRDMLARSDGFAEEAAAMLDAWRDGRDEALAEIALRYLGDPDFEPFYEKILFERNERMVEQIARLARDGKPRLVVVGAAHMLGDRGIPALLEQRGFAVEVFE